MIVHEEQIPNPLAHSGKIVVVDAYEMPDAYGFISAQVPKYWQKHSPHLVVHVEVNRVDRIILHTMSSCCGYTTPDRSDCVPDHCLQLRSGHCEKILSSCLDLQAVVDNASCTNNGLNFQLSSHIGRSIGEFAYHKSLCINPERTVLISVPQPGQSFSPYAISRGISCCVGEVLSQLKDRNLLNPL